MSRIPAIADASATPQAAEALERARRDWGADYNLARVLANSPPLLEAARAFFSGLQSCSLSGPQQEAIALEVACLNDCHYCRPAHVVWGRRAGLSESDIRSILSGGTAEEPEIRAVQRLTRRLAATKGKLSDDEIKAFQDEGISTAQMLEVIGFIAAYTLFTHVNGLAQTEVDEFLRDIEV